MAPARAPGLWVVEPPHLLGMRGTQSYDLVFDGVEIPRSAVVLSWAGERPLDVPGMAIAALWFATLIAAVYAGVADQAAAQARSAARGPHPGIGRIALLQRRIDAVRAGRHHPPTPETSLGLLLGRWDPADAVGHDRRGRSSVAASALCLLESTEAG